MTAAVVTTKNQQSSNWLTAARYLDPRYTKDIFRIPKFVAQWLQTFSASLRDSTPLKSLISMSTTGENALAIGEFAGSICKMGHSLTTDFKDSLVDTIHNLASSFLGLSWNFLKVCKTLKQYQVVSIASKTLTGISAFGGIAFAIDGIDRVQASIRKVLSLENGPATDKKDLEVLYNLYKLAKNIGLLAVGVIVASNAMFGFVASSMAMLVLGTGVLISSITSSILKETYGLK